MLKTGAVPPPPTTIMSAVNIVAFRSATILGIYRTHRKSSGPRAEDIARSELKPLRRASRSRTHGPGGSPDHKSPTR